MAYYSRRSYRRPSGRKTYRTPTQGFCPLKPGFTAIVAEKPKAGEKIAAALGKARKCRYKGIPYWILWNNGNQIVIVPSAGHLFGPHSSQRGFPVFDYKWRPIHEFDKKSIHLKKFFDLMQAILPKASQYINACDYDIEGSVIGYTIIEYFGNIQKYRRMRFSSLSPIDIRRAYRNLDPPDTQLVEAGKARHEIDWLWGINVSRALMHAVRSYSGHSIILSAGRVQSPTIVEAARRWREINLAVPIPEFTLTITLEYAGKQFNVIPKDWKPDTKMEADIIARRLKKEKKLQLINAQSKQTPVNPPPAFNLGDLQREAARLYKYSPMKTQSIAEDLYLEALISYPRTNSQKLPPTIDYYRIIRSLAQSQSFKEPASRLLSETKGILKPVQGRKEDPAHPAIHPTGVNPTKPLDRDHWRIYDLIVRRFLAAFSRRALIERTSLTFQDSKGLPYAGKGIVIIDEGWYYYYPHLKPKTEEFPLIPPKEHVPIISVTVKSSWVRNVPDLSRTSLLKWMEAENIGTEATRARIIETLFKRKYLETRGPKTVVTDLGMMVSEIIKELFPDLSSPELTRKLEKELEQIRLGTKTRPGVVEDAKQVLTKLLEIYQERLLEVGKELAVSIGVAEPEVKCRICDRPVDSKSPRNLCSLHEEAYVRLSRMLPIIAKKLGKDQISAIKSLSKLRGQAGKWVIEVANAILGGQIQMPENS